MAILPDSSARINQILHENGFGPGYTVFPNELLDWIVPLLSEAEYRVLTYLIRRTFGFKKSQDSVSLDQICDGLVDQGSDLRFDRGTGLSKTAARKALKSLHSIWGLVKAEKPSRCGRGAVATYRVVLTGEASYAFLQACGLLSVGTSSCPSDR